MTTPFLSKLRELCCSCPPKVAGWSSDGSKFEVYDSESFEELLGIYFKGSSKTFIRQLHFYSFSKQDMSPGKWCFFHPQFSRDNLDGIFTITRKTRKQETSFATTEDVGMLQNELHELEFSIGREISQLSSELENLARTFQRNLDSFDLQPSETRHERSFSPSMIEFGIGRDPVTEVQMQQENREILPINNSNNDDLEHLSTILSSTGPTGTQEAFDDGDGAGDAVEEHRGERDSRTPAVKTDGSSNKTTPERLDTSTRYRQENNMDEETRKRQRRDSDISK